jgi:hypothetical protein
MMLIAELGRIMRRTTWPSNVKTYEDRSQNGVGACGAVVAVYSRILVRLPQEPVPVDRGDVVQRVSEVDSRSVLRGSAELHVDLDQFTAIGPCSTHGDRRFAPALPR